MLVVNDLEKLSKYGFTKGLFNIYKKILYEDEDYDEVSLLVNNLDDSKSNQLLLYCNIYRVESGEFDIPIIIDIIYDMIKDGVVSKI